MFFQYFLDKNYVGIFAYINFTLTLVLPVVLCYNILYYSVRREFFWMFTLLGTDKPIGI